jgi:3-isopropylmalate/(R)-2-methylmalate dehydratase small subunit
MADASMAAGVATLLRRGRCHVLGDDVSLDGGIIPQRFAAQRITDPAELLPHLFEAVDPTLAQRVRPGDLVLAGRNFACGKPRLQGFIAMAALDLAIVCESMPYKMWRRAVARALPVIVGAPTPRELAATGDELEVDFTTGTLRNLTQGTQRSIPPMPPILRDIVTAGGMQATLKAWLATHPEQAIADQRLT